MSQLTTDIWNTRREHQTKYDYYVIGIAVALLTYFSTNIGSEKELIQNWLDTLTSLLLLISIISGLFVLEKNNEMLSNNYFESLAREKVWEGNKILASYQEVIDLDTAKPVDRENVQKIVELAASFVEKNELTKEKQSKKHLKLINLRNYTLIFAFPMIFLSKLITVIGLSI